MTAVGNDQDHEVRSGSDHGPSQVFDGPEAALSAQADLARLLVAASRGQEFAWREIVERYSRRVFALVKSRCRDFDLAEELTQSVFVTVAAKLGQGLYNEQGRFESWLFRVTMNRVRDHVRRIKRQATVNDSDGLMQQRAAAAEGQAGTDDRLGALREAMGQLTDADREIIELRHHGELSFKQMAELLEEPVGTLLARHHRALKKMKEWIENAGSGATRVRRNEVA